MLVGDDGAAGGQPPPSAGLCLFLPLPSLSSSYPMLGALGGFLFNSSLAHFVPVLTLVLPYLYTRILHVSPIPNPPLSLLAPAPRPSRPLPRIDVVLPWISLPPPRFTLIEACRAQPPSRKPACKPPEAPVPVLLSCLCVEAVSLIISPPSYGPPRPSLLIVVSRDTPVLQRRRKK